METPMERDRVPVTIIVPMGMWILSIVADIIFILGGPPLWTHVAFYAMAGGVAFALFSVLPNAVGLLSLTDLQAATVSLVHIFVYFGIVGVFGLSLWLRTVCPSGSILPLVVAATGILSIVGPRQQIHPYWVRLKRSAQPHLVALTGAWEVAHRRYARVLLTGRAFFAKRMRSSAAARHA